MELFVYKSFEDKHMIRRSGIFSESYLEWIMFFFLKKNILIPNVAEKNILIMVEEKK